MPNPNARKRKPLTFAYAIRSFIGHLEGTEKAAHTITNYRYDLEAFQRFLEHSLGSVPASINHITVADLEKYHAFLKSEGFKTNTRRRKLLTVRRLMRYLKVRNKLTVDVGSRLPAPHKVERIPVTVPTAELLAKIQALPKGDELSARNRVLLWSLAETGCQVSELTRLQFKDWKAPGQVEIRTKKGTRTLSVSRELFEAVQELRSLTPKAGDRPWLFLGYTKSGPLGSPITSRGVELLVRAFAEKHEMPQLTPRTFRHSMVLKWHLEGASKEMIQARLGLRTRYAFRVYEPLFKQVAGASQLG